MRYKMGIITIIIAGGLAYLTGHLLGDILSKRKIASFLNQRKQRTENILKEHVQFGIGDTIPDYVFETLDYDTISFSKCLKDNTVLVAIHPGCETCVEEMSMISTLQLEYNETGPFVFISSANPRLLKDIRDSLKLDNLFLYDHKGKFLSHFGIDIYPMVLWVDDNKQITEIILGSLLPDEIEDALEK